MRKEIFCERCKEQIKKGQKVAGMHTYNDFPVVSDERYFHFNCFLEWRDASVTEAAIKCHKKSMSIIAPMIKPLAENIASAITNAKEETNKVYEVGYSQ